MYELNIFGKFEYFCATLNYCGMFILECSEDDIGYYIFEELDGDFQAFLCEANLKELLQEGYIDQHVYELSRTLHDKLQDIFVSPLWKLEYVTTAPEWLEIFKLSDEIKSLVNVNLDDNMRQLNTFGKYQYFCNTLNHYGMYVVEPSENFVGNYVFEELDTTFRSYLCEENLKELLQEGYIDHHVYELSLKLHDKLEDISKSPLWELKYVTTAPEWLDIHKLSDEIREYQKKSNVGYFY